MQSPVRCSPFATVSNTTHLKCAQYLPLPVTYLFIILIQTKLFSKKSVQYFDRRSAHIQQNKRRFWTETISLRPKINNFIWKVDVLLLPLLKRTINDLQTCEKVQKELALKKIEYECMNEWIAHFGEIKVTAAWPTQTIQV